jgi:hypothetical protein
MDAHALGHDWTPGVLQEPGRLTLLQPLALRFRKRVLPFLRLVKLNFQEVAFHNVGE